MDAVITTGSIVIDCGLCGRVHFASDERTSFEEGELEELREQAKKEPDRYFEHQCCSIQWGYFNGVQVVYDCPCHKARRFEELIWDNRYAILKFLDTRSERRLEDAKDLKGRVNKAKEVMK
jgi:hypothetical protein